jgi:hypothetical protein
VCRSMRQLAGKLGMHLSEHALSTDILRWITLYFFRNPHMLGSGFEKR